MELQALSNGDIPVLPGGEIVGGNHPRNMGKRVKDAHGKAREYLKTSALLTDAYFHYTPSQIMMAALLIADVELTTWYIKSKFPPGAGDMQSKVMATLESCADMLRTVDPDPNPESATAEKKVLSRLSRKLGRCRNPEKMDLVGLQKAKREGELVDEEKVIKKRKLEREMSAKETDDLFGPTIRKP